MVGWQFDINWIFSISEGGRNPDMRFSYSKNFKNTVTDKKRPSWGLIQAHYTFKMSNKKNLIMTWRDSRNWIMDDSALQVRELRRQSCWQGQTKSEIQVFWLFVMHSFLCNAIYNSIYHAINTDLVHLFLNEVFTLFLAKLWQKLGVLCNFKIF